MLTSAGFLLSGLLNEPIHKVIEISRMQFLGKSSFYSLQRNHLYPAINHGYDEKRKCILNGVKYKTLNLIGDGRYNSPGNNSTFGSTTG